MTGESIPELGFREQRRERKELKLLPDAVREFYEAALERARAEGDAFSLSSASRPGNLAELLALADDRTNLVELGTCTGWTAIALTLNAPRARVTTFDPVVHEQRERYLDLVPEAVRSRITFRAEAGVDGATAGTDLVEFLFIDSTHEREGTVAEFTAWRPRLTSSATVVFDDYGHPDYPGVAQAITDLGLRGEVRGSLYVWRGAMG